MLALGPDWLLLPAISGGGGLIAGLLVQIGAPAAQGSGVPQVMQFLRGQPIPMGLEVAAVKLVAGIVAIGSGFPLGPSGPSMQMGSSVGWEMARLLKAPNAFRRMIVAAGGGAGIAAVFNAPIGGFFYTLEELLQGARPVVMLLVLVTTFWADTWADLLGLAGLGTHSTGWNLGRGFVLSRQVTTYVEVLPLDLLVLFVVGAVVALAAELYCRYVVGLHGWRRQLADPPGWRPWPAAGVVLGVVDALLPADFINRAGIRQAVAEGDVDISKALAIFLVLFLSTGSGGRRRRPRRAVRTDAHPRGGPGAGGGGGDGAGGAQRPQHHGVRRHGGLHDRLRPHADHRHLPDLRPHQGAAAAQAGAGGQPGQPRDGPPAASPVDLPATDSPGTSPQRRGSAVCRCCRCRCGHGSSEVRQASAHAWASTRAKHSTHRFVVQVTNCGVSRQSKYS